MTRNLCVVGLLLANVAWAECVEGEDCGSVPVDVAQAATPTPKATPKWTPAPAASPAAATATPAPAPEPPAPPAPPAAPMRLSLDDGTPILPGVGTLGMSIALPAGGSPTVGASYFLLPQGQLRADLGFATRSEPESQTDYSLEFSWRQYIAGARGRVNPFFQPGLFINSIDLGEDNSTTFALTIAAGMELFLLERFSVAAAGGFAYVNRQEPDQSGLNTGTSALFANVYW